MRRRHPPPARRPSRGKPASADAGFSIFRAACSGQSKQSRTDPMNASPDPAAPTLAEVPSNPVPAGAEVNLLETPDGVKLRYATFPKGDGPPRGTICLVHGRTEFIEKYFETIADFQ